MSPKYSIVIPTRNRAHLLRYALECALNQTFTNYEIVVVDNDSADDTPKTVKEIGRERAKYVRTPKTLSMPDNWEFALNHAGGQWITYLTDDSAISTHLLEEVETTLTQFKTKVVSWSHYARYYHPTWHNAAERNILVYPPYSGKRTPFQSRVVLQKLYFLIPDHTLPVMLNSFCRRDVIRQAQEESGRFFFPICPDLSSCANTLALTENYVYIDLPLGINGLGKESIGIAQATTRSKAAAEFRKEFENQQLFTEVPLRNHSVGNYIVESLLRTKRANPRRFEAIKFDWRTYYLSCYQTLQLLEKIGVNVSEEKKELQAALKRQTFSVRSKFAREAFAHDTGISLHNVVYKTRNMLRKAVNGFSLARKLESLVRKPTDFGGTVRGDDGNFSNIFEAMQYLDRHVFPKRTEERLTNGTLIPQIKQKV